MAEPTEQDKLVAQTLLKESDRGCAILGATLLADALEQLLRSFFRQGPGDVRGTIDPLFAGYAPLATFSARIQIAFGLGILARDLRDRIEIIRRLRNDFAHDWGPIDFEDPRCADRLALLIGRPSEAGDPLPTDPEETVWPALGPATTKEQFVTRLAFVLCVTGIVGRLNYLAHLAKEGRDIRRIVHAQEEEQARN